MKEPVDPIEVKVLDDEIHDALEYNSPPAQTSTPTSTYLSYHAGSGRPLLMPRKLSMGWVMNMSGNSMQK